MAHLHLQDRTGTARRLSWLIPILAWLPILLMSCSDTDNAEDKNATMDPTEISVAQLKAEADSGKEFFLVDVRTEPEYAAGHLSFTDALIDYRELPSMMAYLPQDTTVTIYCFCRSGRRSGITTDFLRQEGYVNAFNVKGGIIAWVDAGYPLDTGLVK